jgi:hypothetical protein
MAVLCLFVFFGSIFLWKEHPALCRYTHSIALDLLLQYRCRCVADRTYMVCGSDDPAQYHFFTTLYSPHTTVTGGVLFYAHTVHS